MTINPGRGPGRIEFRADDPSLTPYAGLAVSGELCRSLRLTELVDGELAAARVTPVKQRQRGLSPGALAMAIAEAQLTGAECFDDVQDVRADRAGAPLRAVAQTPSAPTARQLAYRFRLGHIRAIERATARCGNELDRKLGRDLTEGVTFDLDATETPVYGQAGDWAQPPRQPRLQLIRGHVGAARACHDQRAQRRKPGADQGSGVRSDARSRRAAAASRARADHGSRRLGLLLGRADDGLP